MIPPYIIVYILRYLNPLFKNYKSYFAHLRDLKLVCKEWKSIAVKVQNHLINTSDHFLLDHFIKEEIKDGLQLRISDLVILKNLPLKYHPYVEKLILFRGYPDIPSNFTNLKRLTIYSYNRDTITHLVTKKPKYPNHLKSVENLKINFPFDKHLSSVEIDLESTLNEIPLFPDVLKKLTLKGNATLGFISTCRAILKFHNLCSLELEISNLVPTDIFTMVSTANSLVRLTINFYKSISSDADPILQVICKTSNLERLELNGCSLNLKNMIESINQNNSIREIDFSANDIIKFPNEQPTITNTRLEYFNIDPEILHHLWKNVPSNLKIVSLSDPTMEYLSNTHPQCQNLNFSGDNFGTSYEELCKIIQLNSPKLTKLTLDTPYQWKYNHELSSMVMKSFANNNHFESIIIHVGVTADSFNSLVNLKLRNLRKIGFFRILAEKYSEITTSVISNSHLEYVHMTLSNSKENVIEYIEQMCLVINQNHSIKSLSMSNSQSRDIPKSAFEHLKKTISNNSQYLHHISGVSSPQALKVLNQYLISPYNNSVE
ncbi:hypothetical protein DLAC_00375 [Tieghemostelium lacteum]|uniref:F-box domain-containing protein n=1 Tax=Tieghemostelium lacteum TaxID=361077 RepID=A0A152AA03_TIELA|nr:hypothetical protein DLAC_00375 [Tieghemostelium lacteum]|eukprot:KYR02897.1 hypothetical protein DLAC_00375 [Tieghemostelium lacteum]